MNTCQSNGSLVIDFINQNKDTWFESPRKYFFGGRSSRAQKFKLSFNRKTDKVIFEFESGTKLGIEQWRIIESEKLLENKGKVSIGARISEGYSSDSLEGHLKEIAKSMYGRATDTKTAPHIADLLVIAEFAELDYAKSPSGRKVQGIRLK
ncbi:MAG: hypothetical protein R6U44_09405 [Archaeoglobaceae archaeon]